MKLYYHPFSNFSRKVRMVMIEKGVEPELQVIDLMSRENRSPEYLAINPMGKVPALVDDGLTLYESTVINEYLEETHPEPALFPKDARERARARLVDAVHDESLLPAMGPAFRETFKPEDSRDAEKIAKCREKGRPILKALSNLLGDRDYFCGDFSIADIALAPTAHFYEMMYAEDLAAFPNLVAWFERVKARPSFRQTVPGA